MPSKDKISIQLKQKLVYIWSCSEENCNLSYIGKSSRCFENRAKQHNSHVTSAIYKHSISKSHLQATISKFKIIDQDRKQVTREAGKVIHVRINNTAIKHNTGKMYIQKFSTTFLEQTNLPVSLSGRLRPSTRSHSSHHSKQQALHSNVFGKLSILSITTHSTGILPCHQLSSVMTHN